MTFSIIGTGNIAWFMGKRLVEGQHRCAGIYGRNIKAAEELAEALMADRYGAPGDVEDGVADICILAVSDSAITEVCKQVSFKHTALVHTAGAVSIDSIRCAAKDCGVLWPVYSIVKNNLPSDRNIPCAWEASTPDAEKYMQLMGHAITDVLFEAKYEQRKWLHLGAVIGNNFINHLMAICEQLCVEHQIPFSILQPILGQTFDRMKHDSPKYLQTGPAMRRDTTTIEAQIKLLAGHKEWQEVYEAMTHSIQI